MKNQNTNLRKSDTYEIRKGPGSRTHETSSIPKLTEKQPPKPKK